MLFDTKIEHRTAPERPIQEMWQEYCDILQGTKRVGIGRLLNWMQSDMGNGTLNFVDAPASTRFHGSYKGGLLEHSLNVYNRLCLLVSNECSMMPRELREDEELSSRLINSVKVVALLHDLCKIGFYKDDWSNKKVYSENGSKQDEGGRFDWVAVHQYRILDTHKFGHGAASVEIAERFMGINGLTEEEKYAIRYHMGDFANERETGDVYNRYPLATLLHMADIAATYLDERECDESGDIFWANLNTFARTVKKKTEDTDTQRGGNNGQAAESH
jgi:hypothetical protein